ncbi:hypothetical protein CLF_110857 [Clonorchis sinensis]|uniref:Uncharacterized protein n=1 Tax=Clonorchis sinensis TaxID=79923 RepID=G7YTZ7_CLOSI|nr:hypothetical protein CLF_110857 [Clonorchis sinensis]
MRLAFDPNQPCGSTLRFAGLEINTSMTNFSNCMGLSLDIRAKLSNYLTSVCLLNDFFSLFLPVMFRIAVRTHINQELKRCSESSEADHFQVFILERQVVRWSIVLPTDIAKQFHKFRYKLHRPLDVECSFDTTTDYSHPSSVVYAVTQAEDAQRPTEYIKSGTPVNFVEPRKRPGDNVMLTSVTAAVLKSRTIASANRHAKPLSVLSSLVEVELLTEKANGEQPNKEQGVSVLREIVLRGRLEATECVAPGRLMFQLLRYSRYGDTLRIICQLKLVAIVERTLLDGFGTEMILGRPTYGMWMQRTYNLRLHHSRMNSPPSDQLYCANPATSPDRLPWSLSFRNSQLSCHLPGRMPLVLPPRPFLDASESTPKGGEYWRQASLSSVVHVLDYVAG